MDSIAKLLAVNCSSSIREKLAVAEGEAVLLLDEVSYYKMSCPILHTFAYYTNFFEFTIMRKKL